MKTFSNQNIAPFGALSKGAFRRACTHGGFCSLARVTMLSNEAKICHRATNLIAFMCPRRRTQTKHERKKKQLADFP